jgi:hypothetical protein
MGNKTNSNALHILFMNGLWYRLPSFAWQHEHFAIMHRLSSIIAECVGGSLIWSARWFVVTIHYWTGKREKLTEPVPTVRDYLWSWKKRLPEIGAVIKKTLLSGFEYNLLVPASRVFQSSTGTSENLGKYMNMKSPFLTFLQHDFKTGATGGIHNPHRLCWRWCTSWLDRYIRRMRIF